MKRQLLLLFLVTLLSGSSIVQAQYNPRNGWKDSFEHKGKCWCDNNTNYDHNLSSKNLRINGRNYNIIKVCEELRKHPDYRNLRNGDPIYNDIQCGNGPANDAPDEAGCPGRVDLGPSGCDMIGPKFDMSWLESRPVFGGEDNNGGGILGNVTMKAEINNLYVCSENGRKAMNANRAKIGAWEVFKIAATSGGKVSIQGNNGKYVSSENGVGSMTCTKSSVGSTELFTLESQGGNVYALKGNNGKYVSSERAKRSMTCNRSKVGTWERFIILKTNKSPSDTYSLDQSVTIGSNPVLNLADVEITFDLGQDTYTSFSVYTMNGQKVTEQIIGDLGVGSFSFSLGEFDMPISTQGLYLLNIRLGSNIITKKLIVK